MRREHDTANPKQAEAFTQSYDLNDGSLLSDPSRGRGAGNGRNRLYLLSAPALAESSTMVHYDMAVYVCGGHIVTNT